VPLLDSTKEMINKNSLAMMRDGVTIINFSRGGLVHNDDIKEAIKSGKVSSYVTDFPSADLLGVDGVIPIPHLGASTKESEDNCAIMAVHEVKDFLENGNITNSVNFPNCTLPKKDDKKRVCITNKNIPNMISTITSFLADQDINICDMINQSRADLAYNIIDIESDISQESIQSLKDIEGIIAVRVI
jgi:D-3-phosphoglycerate dehydrogenase